MSGEAEAGSTMGGNLPRNSRMWTTVHIVREALWPPTTFFFHEPESTHALNPHIIRQSEAIHPGIKDLAMKEIEDEYIYEVKMDQITDYLEGIILDALLSVLKNLKHKNDLLASQPSPHQTNDTQF